MSKRVWMITGASVAVGAQLAKAALAAGEQVVASSRDLDRLEAVLGEETANLSLVQMDVTSVAQASMAVQTALARFGRIDILVNAAGQEEAAYDADRNPAETERQFSVKVYGLLNVTRAALPSMRQRRQGKIINFAPPASALSGADQGLPPASALAIAGISQALAAEACPGIHIKLIAAADLMPAVLGTWAVQAGAEACHA